jgi:5'-nucleotidase
MPPLRILVTNDDGIRAPGLRHLVDAVSPYGEVKIAAPDRERSACGHALTMRDPLRAKEFRWDNLEALEINGFPTDCINIGRHVLWPDGCDLVVSGINNGPNLGFDVTYSGTVAGAMEGAINGIPSIAFSMVVFVDDSPVHWETGQRWVYENLRLLLDLQVPPNIFLNVNIPSIRYEEIEGHWFCGMGQRVYNERIEERADPWERTYYWQGGVQAMENPDPGTDVQATSNGYVAISPLKLDWTDYDVLDGLVTRAKSGATFRRP